jgi:hypothetical protein
MVEMTCEEHDRQAASTQFITHTVGRMLGTMELEETSINTKGYESLLSLVSNTNNDSFELYYGQGLTLVHFSAQLEPFLTQNTPRTPPRYSECPLTPPEHHPNNPSLHPYTP